MIDKELPPPYPWADSLRQQKNGLWNWSWENGNHTMFADLTLEDGLTRLGSWIKRHIDNGINPYPNYKNRMERCESPA